jgi:hypothetical protein
LRRKFKLFSRATTRYENDRMRGFACACRTAFTICLVLFGFPLLEAQANNKADELSRDELLRQFRLDDLEQSLPPLGNLAERQYFGGMLANRKNDVVSSVRLLKEALKHMPPARLDRTALAEQALADPPRLSPPKHGHLCRHSSLRTRSVVLRGYGANGTSWL